MHKDTHAIEQDGGSVNIVSGDVVHSAYELSLVRVTIIILGYYDKIFNKSKSNIVRRLGAMS